MYSLGIQRGTALCEGSGLTMSRKVGQTSRKRRQVYTLTCVNVCVLYIFENEGCVEFKFCGTCHCPVVLMSTMSAQEREVARALLQMGRLVVPPAAPPPIRAFGLGHGYHPVGDVRLTPAEYAGAMFDGELCVTFVAMMNAGEYVFPTCVARASRVSCWRFYAVVSSTLPVGACCVIWYTSEKHDHRCVSAAAAKLGLRDLQGAPVRGSLFATVITADGKTAHVPTQLVFGGHLRVVAHAPSLVVHVPSLLYTAALRGPRGAL